MEQNIIDIYHDESKEHGYWHGFLFVPRSTRAALLDLLDDARELHGITGKVRFCEVGRKKKISDGKPAIVRSWLSIGLAAVQQAKLNSNPPWVFLGRKGKGTPEYVNLEKLIYAKLVVFRERDSHEKCFFLNDPLRNIETTFRMGLKGALHRLYSDDNPVIIGNIYIDGDEHYYGEFGRGISLSNILGRIKSEARTYITLTPNSTIVALRSDHRLCEQNENPDNCHLLQFIDILLGGIRLNVLAPEVGDVRLKISEPSREMLSYDLGNSARMANSRYRDAFLFSEAWIESGQWGFSPLNPYSHRVEESIQQSLF